MNMPGFTAEESLYQTNEHYYAAIEGAHACGSVHPAQIALPYDPLLSEVIRRPPCWKLFCEPLREVYPGVFYPGNCRWLNIC